jgi:hypothetical protein
MPPTAHPESANILTSPRVLTSIHPMRISRPFFTTFLLVALVVSSSCRKSEPPSAPADAPAVHATDEWIPISGMAPGQWMPIDGATDVAWDAETQTFKIDFGYELNGVRWTGPLPAAPYELELEARRVSGSDFFCGLTFPVRTAEECVTFIVGGWGGNLVGISSIDGLDAAQNPTASSQPFDDGRWYRLRVRVEPDRLQAWIDDRNMADVPLDGRKLSLREGPIHDCAPLGLATWNTRAEMRAIRWRKITP